MISLGYKSVKLIFKDQLLILIYQTRGGCACAGPYAQDLLGIDVRLSLDFENALREDR